MVFDLDDTGDYEPDFNQNNSGDELPKRPVDSEFDPDRFWREKILPAKLIFRKSNEFTPSMVNQWITDIDNKIRNNSSQNLSNKYRIIRAISESKPTRKKDPQPYLTQIEEELGSKWLEEFQTGTFYLGESKEFSKLSIAQKYPKRDTEERELFQGILGCLDRDVINTVLGEVNHFTALIENTSKFTDELNIGLSEMYSSGYIGKLDLEEIEDEYNPAKVYVRKGLVEKFETRDSNPYTL